MIEILPIEKCPSWVVYPEYYLELFRNGKDEFLPWHLTDIDDTLRKNKSLKWRYWGRTLFPFARKISSDDIACWQKGQGQRVFNIHVYASSGWEQRKIFEDFKSWHEWALTQVEDY